MSELRESGKAALLLFVAAILQVSVLAPLEVGGGRPDVLLVTLVAVALLRGSLAGAGGGFFAGLIVDVATLATLGMTSLVLGLVGYWIGRYGETTGRDRTHAAPLSVLVATVLAGVGTYALLFMLGVEVSARLALVDALLPALLLNLVLAAPVFALVRRVARRRDTGTRTAEVQLLA